MSEELTLERLKQLQELPLERKVGFTIARITEFYDHYDGKCYVSFSGGKDSTVLLYIARKLFPEIKAVFIDTGLEYPEIRDFVKTWDNVDWVKPEKSFLQVIKEHGFPAISKEVSEAVYYAKLGSSWALGKMGLGERKNQKQFSYPKYSYLVDAPFNLSAKCCTIMKKSPTKKYETDTGLHPIMATMTEESVLRRSGWLRTGCNAFDSKRPHSNPMSFWTEQDVLKYLKLMNIPIAKVYGTIEVESRGGRSTTSQQGHKELDVCSVCMEYI